MINFYKRNKNLLHNFSSLSLLQFANYLFPLIVLPYLVRVLGPEKYGLVQFAAAFNAYFILICDYGFGLSAIKLISVERESKTKISEIFSSILVVKSLLFLISLVLLVIIVFSFERFTEEYLVFLLSFGLVFGNVFSPTWFFQGMERMKYITYINVSVRAIATVFVFILIRSQSDYLILVILNSITQILIGVAGVIIAIKKFGLNLLIPSVSQIKWMFNYGWNLFLSSISINLYTTSNIFLLGLFTNDTIVGYYSAADKIRIAFQGIQSNISLTVFPYVCKLAKESYTKFINFNRKLFFANGAIGLSVSLTMFFLSYWLTDLILGEQFIESGYVLKIIAFLPFIISLSNVMGIQTMLPLGYEKAFNKIIATAAILHLLLLFVFVPKYSEIGVAVVVVFTELLISILMFGFIIKKRINIFKKNGV